ncbi:hypothetical protein [Ruegeria lacuscaerulensis]|uniref:hypothetical protein n=1 Tax=Ruegeria lacuscaerulensis TaxID=55218 RepID=UPI001480D939|nr:hypothetical protein [Ruegeria lacuscaerulensis]
MFFDFLGKTEIQAALIGALFGGFFGATVPLLVSSVEENRKKRRIKRAFAPEIRSIISATAQAGLLELINDFETKISKGEEIIVPSLFYENLTYDPVFAANTENIGLIEADLAQRVTSFYRRVRLGRFRIIAYQQKKIGESEREGFLHALKIMKSAIDDLEDAERLATELDR